MAILVASDSLPTADDSIFVVNSGLPAGNDYTPFPASRIIGVLDAGGLQSEFNSWNYFELSIKLPTPSGLSLGLTGLSVADALAGDGLTIASKVMSLDLDTTPGLEFNTGKIRVKVGDGIQRTLAGIEVDSSVVRTTRIITAGAGLTGGGTLAADRTLNVGAGTLITVAADTVSVTPGANHQFIGTGADTAASWRDVSTLAGNGLTHAASVLAVGAGTLITVGADTVGITAGANHQFVGTGTGTAAGWRNVSELAGNGLTHAASVLSVALSTNAGLELVGTAPNQTLQVRHTTDIVRDASGLSVNRAIVPTWTGVHTFTARPVISNNLLFSGAARTILTDSDWPLTLAPAGTGQLILNPGGTVTLAAAKIIRAATYTNAFTGIAGFDLSDRGGNFYQMTVGGIKADELYAKVFVADETRVDRGSEFWSKSYGVVETDFTAPAIGSTVDVWFEDAAALTGNIFAVGDWLMVRGINWGTSLTLFRMWFEITALVTASSGGRQRWRLARRAGGATGQEIKAGNVMIDVGVAGQGTIELSALVQDKGPFIRMGNWTTNPFTPANWAHRVQMGHLDGVAGYGAGRWGFAAGKNLGASASAFEGMLIEATDGARLLNTAIEMYLSGTRVGLWSPTTGIQFDNALTDTNPYAVSWYSDGVERGRISSFYGASFNYLSCISTATGTTRRANATMRAVKDVASGFLEVDSNGGSSGGVATFGVANTQGNTDISINDNGIWIAATRGVVGIATGPDVIAQLKVQSRSTTIRAGLFVGRTSMTVPVLEVQTSGLQPIFSAANTGHVRAHSGLSVGSITENYADGVVNATVGFRTAGTAGAGTYLRGNGTNFVEAAIQAADLPANLTNYIWNTSSAQTANMNVTGQFILTGELGTAWFAATLATGWTTFTDPAWETPGYKRIGTLIEVKGMIQASSAQVSGATMFTLPTGYRPTKYRMFITWSTAGLVRIDVRSTGAVVVQAAIPAAGVVNVDFSFFV